MKTLVIADFPAKQGKFSELEAALRAALPDTRAFDGCHSLETHLHPETDTLTLVEYWESPEHYQRYLAWRAENGLPEALDDLLEGGFAAFKPRTFVATDI
ncbi:MULTISPECIES: antibiotic biosynthesis monooxygenase family protein [unclassified Novosphingobium]|uniref:putative quinol monooxygenase n=1 Tax=unclassified Novosphingobium TaxID=2644732 RepID=UPI0025DE2C0D|nr:MULTISPECIES: antibiotic biosynthesis monooxygenase family protein [unclassified Novosphingobium]HQV03522.1 antibiotic biosynthesis monooxygenase [Novosphingobium sp.]